MSFAFVQTADRMINQLQNNIKQYLATLFAARDSGSWTATLTGCSTVPTGKCSWVSSMDHVVVLSVSTIQGTSNASVATLTGLPVNLWPQTTQCVAVPTIDNGNAPVMAFCAIGTEGTIRIYKNLAQSGFTSSGTKGILATTFTYNADI